MSFTLIILALSMRLVKKVDFLRTIVRTSFRRSCRRSSTAGIDFDMIRQQVSFEHI